MAKIFGIHVPAETKNYAINGNFDFWQRNTSSNQTGLSSSAYLTADRIKVDTNWASGNPNFTISRGTSIPSTAQSGFTSQYSYQISSSVSKTFPGTSDYFQPFQYRMEGLEFQRLVGKPFTINFWFSTNVPGIYSVTINNISGSRQFVTTFTATSGWQFVTVTIPGDTATAGVDNTEALRVALCSLGAAGLLTSTLNTWGNFGVSGALTATNYLATVGAQINIAQFSIYEGTLSPGALGFQRAGKSIQQELMMAQRYYEKSYDLVTIPGTATSVGAVEWFSPTTINNADVFDVKLKVSKRTTGATAVMWSPATTSLPGNFTNLSTSTNYTGSFTNVCEQSMLAVFGPGASVAPGQLARFQWTVDAEL